MDRQIGTWGIHIFYLYCLLLYYTPSLLKQTPCCWPNQCRSPNNETSSLCSWIHVCSPTAFLSVALLYFLFTGGFPNLPVNSFLSLWTCNSTQFHNDGSKQWPEQSTHINHHERSEIQPISGRICSFIIMGNNTTLGTNCHTIPRPVVSQYCFFLITHTHTRAQKSRQPGIYI